MLHTIDAPSQSIAPVQFITN